MNKWRYFYYPCQFGWHAALRRRSLLMSGVLAILLLIIAIFAENWLVFDQWLHYETNSGAESDGSRICQIGFSFAFAALRT